MSWATLDDKETMRLPHVLAACCALIVLTASSAAAQDGAPASQFIIRKGKDTVAIERFTRDAGTLTGQLSQTNGVRVEYVANLRPDQTVEHIEMSRQNLQGQTLTLSIDFGDTLISAAFQTGEKKQEMKIATQTRPIPFLVNSFALLEQIARASHPAEGQKVKWTATRLGAGDTASISVTRGLADTVVISAPNGDVKLVMAKSGDVIAGLFAPAEWTIERRPGGK